MAAPSERFVDINGKPCRIWQKGEGRAVGYLPGYGGLLHWTPFLEGLAARRRTVALSLPGWPGGLGHEELDTPLDWYLAARDLLAAAELADADLVGVGFGGAIAAEIAAIWPEAVRRLVLIGPFGLFDADRPIKDVFALRPNTAPSVVSAEPARFEAALACPDDADPVEWEIVKIRANEAAARLFWPLGDLRLERRLGRVTAPTLLVWGAADQVVAPAYAGRFAELLGGPVETATIDGAGHLADFDRPEAVADVVNAFLDRPPAR